MIWNKFLKPTSTSYLETCWSRALICCLKQPWLAQLIHLSGFLKEYHGHKLVKNHVFLRGFQAMCEDDPGDFEQSIFQAPSLTSEDKKKRREILCPNLDAHIWFVWQRACCVQPSPALLSGSSRGLCAGLGAMHSCWGQVVSFVSACRAVRQWSVSATCLYFGLECVSSCCSCSLVNELFPLWRAEQLFKALLGLAIRWDPSWLRNGPHYEKHCSFSLTAYPG